MNLPGSHRDQINIRGLLCQPLCLSFLFHDEAGLSRLKTGILHNIFIEMLHFSYILRRLRLDDSEIRQVPEKRKAKKEKSHEKNGNSCICGRDGFLGCNLFFDVRSRLQPRTGSTAPAAIGGPGTRHPGPASPGRHPTGASPDCPTWCPGRPECFPDPDRHDRGSGQTNYGQPGRNEAKGREDGI
jgi:hypothetical protein